MSRSISDLDPDVAEKASQLLLAATASGIHLGITQTYRTFEEQAALYAQGRTSGGVIVTHAPPGYSWHNWRRAFDVDIVDFPGKGLDDKSVYDGPWETVGSLGERVGLEWGGRWKFPDRPHFEVRLPDTLAALVAKNPDGLA